jgi:biotin carboxylase
MSVDAYLTSRSDYLAHLYFDVAKPDDTLNQLHALPVSILGVVVGSELGIECGDWISERLGLPSNGTSGSEARRDKFIMQERIRSVGIRSVKQARASSWEEVVIFSSDASFPLVLKPVRSAGSDHIFKCFDRDQMKHAFDAIMLEQNVFGAQNQAVVVQEFLEGKEYIVDTVSKDGVHKVIALWEYDKRAHAGHEFVYFGMVSVAGTSAIGAALCAYTLRVLDALGIRHGAGHAEVIITKDGPCLVEVGARPQGCEGHDKRTRSEGVSEFDASADS